MINISVFMVYNLYNDWCIVDCFRMDDGHYLQSAFVSFFKINAFEIQASYHAYNAAFHIISIDEIELILKK